MATTVRALRRPMCGQRIRRRLDRTHATAAPSCPQRSLSLQAANPPPHPPDVHTSFRLRLPLPFRGPAPQADDWSFEHAEDVLLWQPSCSGDRLRRLAHKARQNSLSPPACARGEHTPASSSSELLRKRKAGQPAHAPPSQSGKRALLPEQEGQPAAKAAKAVPVSSAGQRTTDPRDARAPSASGRASLWSGWSRQRGGVNAQGGERRKGKGSSSEGRERREIVYQCVSVCVCVCVSV